MIKKIVKDMPINTDKNGVLIINSKNTDSKEKLSDLRFYKCRMNRASDKKQEVAEEAEKSDFEMTELEAFNADLRLAEFAARVEKGELTEGEQAGLNALRFGIDFQLPDELKNV